jgi:hypothetical protein
VLIEYLFKLCFTRKSLAFFNILDPEPDPGAKLRYQQLTIIIIFQVRTVCGTCQNFFCKAHLQSTCTNCWGLLVDLTDVPLVPGDQVLAECMVPVANSPSVVVATPTATPTATTTATPVTPSSSVQFILMQQMHQQLFQLTQQIGTMHQGRTRTGTPRAIDFASPSAASSSKEVPGPERDESDGELPSPGKPVRS